MAFDGRFAGRKTLLDVFGLGRRVEKPDFLRCRAFLIISYKASIFSLCLVYADDMAAAMVEVITLEIKYCIAGSITGRDMPEVSYWNCDTVFE